jgi:hypothetical protein
MYPTAYLATKCYNAAVISHNPLIFMDNERENVEETTTEEEKDVEETDEDDAE